MIKYRRWQYPSDIPLRIQEIPAHFDTKRIKRELEISLHTEYSFEKRKWDSPYIIKYSELIASQKKGIPQLWKNEKWALQFADYITDLVENSSAPKVIEIHPPFNDYTDITGFVKCYAAFEKRITACFPDIQILVENRSGTRYSGKGCAFVISTNNDIKMLCDELLYADLRLKIAYDIPQIYTAHRAKTEKEYVNLLEEAKSFREYIGGVHLWGRQKTSHQGDLNAYFGDTSIKKHFLETFLDCFNDGITRKMVLEVNSNNNDLLSIVSDLRGVGINFV